MRRLPLVIVVVLLTAWGVGCAVHTHGGISERTILDETPTPTPKPGAHQPSARDQQGLDYYLNQQAHENRRRTPTPTPPPAATPPPSHRPHDHNPISPPETTPPPPETTPPPNVPETPPATQSAPSVLSSQPPPLPVESSHWRTAQTLARTAQKKAALALAREGHDLLRARHYDLAERRFEKAISMDSSCGYAYLGLAERRFIQGRWDEAADLAMKAALRLRGDNYFLSRACLVAAKALVNNHQAQEAFGQARSAATADPDNQEAAELVRQLEAYLGPNTP